MKVTELITLTMWLITLTVVTKCFEYCLWAIFDKDVPWYLDFVGGIVTGGLSVPVAVVCYILNVGGVDFPIIHS